MKKVLTFIIALAFTLGVSAQNYDVIDPELQRVLNQKSNDKISINIVLDTQVDNEHLLVKYDGINDKSLKRENVIKELKAFATDNQNKLMALLQDEAGNDKVIDIKAHWLVNSINCSASRDVIYKLSEQPGISVIGLNDKVKLLSDERPTRVSQSKSIIDNVTTVGADNVWDAGYTGKDVIVAVLDSGVNSEHVDLADHLWDGGNEYPDHGWNFIDNNSNTNDYNGHGTHCAGTICGDGTSGTQTGMAPDATLMCVKVLDDEGSGTLEALVSGVEFAVEHGADIMSISLGWTFPTSYVSIIMREMFENVLAAGVVAAVAAGNERDGIDTIPVPRNITAPGNCPPPWLHPDQQYNPGGLSAVVSVGAVDYSDDVAYFSSRGPVTWQGTEWDDYKYDFRYNDKINLEEGWLYYDNGIRTEGIGGPDYFQWGIMIPAAALQQYEGSYMTKVAIYDLVADNPQLLIYYGGDYAPETLVYAQDCELSGSNSMVEIELDEALPVYDENIWVVMYTQNGTSYPAACCDNTGNPNGRWLSIDGTTWEDLLDYGLNNTWMLRAYVTDYNTMDVAELNTITDYEFPTSSKGTLSVSGLGTSRMTAASNEDYFGLIRPDVCAPGVSIVSSAYDDNYGFYSMSGTSMATPCVAGVMALMLDKDPSLTPADICRILETTATKLESTKSNFSGSGRINADMAINEIENTEGNNPITQKHRNVLIEEFTGKYCGFCPDGHRMANEIAAANPGKVFPINIHAGGYSTTDYPNLNTTDGNAIMNGFNVYAFPSGNVNRNSNSAIGRYEWESETNTQLSQLTEVNIAGNVAINPTTRQAEITVELDYLSNSNYSTNYLTIMMLQDSIWGSQSGATSNPSQVVNGQYCQMHVLRDVITNTWGDAITPTTAGTHLTKTYIYEIPEVIGNPNGVEVDLDNIYFLAFVTEKQDGTPTRPVLNVNKLVRETNSDEPVTPQSPLTFLYEGNDVTNSINNIVIEKEINECYEIQFDLVVGNNTANNMNVVCEKDISGIGQNYICWGNCYMPGTTMATNTVYAGGDAIFNGHAVFYDEDWNELPKGTVIPVRYTFYDESNPSEQYVFNVKFIYENDDTANYWTPDESLYANNMTVITTVEIEGEEQYNPNLELGAFCNGELRGSARLQYVDAPANRYECFLMVYGNSGDDITFRLYDHSTGLESDLKSNEVVDFEVNASIGDVTNPYTVNFIGSVIHSRDLTSGWNWYSTYIINEGAEGLTNLEAAVGTNGIQIKNQTKFVNQASGNWYGTLTSTAVEDMFMIQMSAAHTLNLEGYVVNPADHPITLGTNWKWISYPLAAEMSVEEAFASANPSNGDYVKSQKGFAQYYEGLGWSGTLQVMTPGMGYMYQNTSGYAKTLVFPMANAKSKAEAEVEENLHWTANATKYPMNMTVIAVVEDAARDYEVAAFSNGECRGSARPVYIEALGQSLIFMTIYGDDKDAVTFRYYDVTTGEEVALNDEMTFEVNATHGDIMQPYVMTLSTMGIDETSAGFSIYPNPVQDKLYIEAEAVIEEIVVYDVYGRVQNLRNSETQKLRNSIDVSDLNSGVYFVQIKTEEGNITKRFVKE